MTRQQRALLAGVLGGIAGTFAMATCGQLWSAVDPRGGPVARERRRARSGVGAGRFAQSEPRSHERDDTPSEALARRLPGVRTKQRERVVGSAIHYAFGATAGAAYAIALDAAPARVARVLQSGRGMFYGTLVWLLAGEIAVPMSGLAPTPRESPPRLHAYALAGHLAYGAVLEQVRRVADRVSSTRVSPYFSPGGEKTWPNPWPGRE
jgi:uncharacterized membrane protein YagU involved in acid resistance